MTRINDRLVIILYKLMSKLFVVLLCLLLSAVQAGKYANCVEYMEALYKSIFQQDYTSLPLPTLMYSGITTNNPGQMYECEHKTPIGDPYHYLLVSYKNATNNVETFTGVCVPDSCSKEEVEVALQLLKIKYSNVYDYPKDPQTDGLMVACAIFVGLWLGVLVIWSIVLSCREPVENEFLKKDEEVRRPDATQEPINALSEQKPEKKEDYKIFNFYQGYCRIFKRSNQKSVMGSILFLATLSIILSTQFSYRQTIAANQVKSMNWFNSLGGVLFCNIEIAYSVIIFVLGVKLAGNLFRLSSFHEIGRYFFDQLLVKWAILVLTSMAAYLVLSWTDEPLNQLWINKYGADCPTIIYQMWFVFRSLILDCKVCLQWFWIMEVDILLTLIAAPLFIVYRTKRWLGYTLFGISVFISIIFAFAVLDSENILFEPYKLFNMAKQFTVNYQTNAIIRLSPYAIGFLLGLFINERNEKSESGRRQQDLKIVNAIRGSDSLQVALHVLGFGVMLLTYLLIIPYLPVAAPDETRTAAYGYIVFAPFGFLLGLSLFLLPCLLQTESKLTQLLNKILGASFWTSLERMCLGFLLLGPVIIGFTTYSMQNSIYFDFETVFVYFLGDSVIIYIITLLAISSIDNQLLAISRWTQAKVFGNESKYSSVIVIED